MILCVAGNHPNSSLKYRSPYALSRRKFEVPIRILIAEDDRPLSALIRRVLNEEGYAIDVANTGEEARMLAFVNEYDGIILDANLGDRHGFEIIQELRSRGKATPVLLYTGVDDSAAIVRGLDAGADYYVVKPVPNDVLKARVRCLLRRGPASRTSEQITVGELHLNRLTRRAMTKSGDLDLTPIELKLLEYFMMNSGRVVTRSELHDRVWDNHFDPSSNMVDVHIARLRRKMSVVSGSVTLSTRRGVGFILEAVASHARRSDGTPHHGEVRQLISA
jgi:DNA-binding response OmpR family regulator